MFVFDTKKREAPSRAPAKKHMPKNKSSPYDGIIQRASLVGNSAMEAYLRQEAAPHSNALAPESGGRELPPSLRERMEARTGIPLDDVRVHYNSDKPARLGALAYARGSEVHIGPGQEEHLEHELGHVAQQKQNRVQATDDIGSESVNEDAKLEEEANSPVKLATSSSAPKEQPIQFMKKRINTPFPKKSEKDYISALDARCFVSDEFQEKHLSSKDDIEVAKKKTKNRRDNAPINTVFVGTNDFFEDVKQKNKNHVLNREETYISEKSYLYYVINKNSLTLEDTGTGEIEYTVAKIDDLPNDYPNITIHKANHLESIGADSTPLSDCSEDYDEEDSTGEDYDVEYLCDIDFSREDYDDEI